MPTTQRIRGVSQHIREGGVVVVVAVCLALAGCGGGGGGGGGSAGGGGRDTRIPDIPPPLALQALMNFTSAGGGTSAPITSTTGGGTSTSTSGGGGMPSAMLGGVGRIDNVAVNGRHAIVSIASTQGIMGFLADHTTTQLLVSPNRIFDFNNNNRQPRLIVTPPGTERIQAGDGPHLGRKFLFLNREGNPMSVYIDDRAAVALGHELRASNSYEFVAIGEIAPRQLPLGTARYAGLSAFATTDPMQDPDSRVFEMEVNFDTRQVTSFNTITSDLGRLTMEAIPGDTPNPNIPAAGHLKINMQTGSFTGTLNFEKGTLTATPLYKNTMGSIYGQFHGNDAIGVTGVFHSEDNTILGGFAGAKTSQ